jgi:putative colanic acid biosynthesis acetyltransferase WcaF
MGNEVDCYSVGKVVIGARAVVSQYTYLCSATHDYEDPHFGLLAGPITIGADAWVAADCFIGPGVTIGEGAVVGARSSVFRDVPSMAVVVGSPAKTIKVRKLSSLGGA